MAPRKPNAKAEAAKEKKAAAQAVKDAASAREAEKNEAAQWKVGANNRGAARAENAASKADEAARKRREKAALLAEEEEASSGSNVRPSRTVGAGMKAKQSKASGKKSKKKSDLDLLEEALVGDAEKKSRAQKKAERERKEREERARLDKERRTGEEAAATVDPLLANTDAMLSQCRYGRAIGQHCLRGCCRCQWNRWRYIGLKHGQWCRGRG